MPIKVTFKFCFPVCLVLGMALTAVTSAHADSWPGGKKFAAPGTHPRGLVLVNGDFWHTDFDTGRLYRISTNGTVLAEHLLDFPGPRGAAFDGTNLWVSASNVIHCVSAADGSTIRTIPGPDSQLTGLAYHEGALWVGCWTRHSLCACSPVDGTVLRELPAPARKPRGVAFHAGFLWNTNSDSDRLYKIDPSSGDCTVAYPVRPGHLRGLVWFGDQVVMLDNEADEFVWFCLPLMSTTWNQRGEFTRFSPAGERLGCWSTAVAQILAYHRLLPHGRESYSCTPGYVIDEDLGSYLFDWIRFVGYVDETTPQPCIAEVALYGYYAACAVRKDFGTGTYAASYDGRAEGVEDHFDCRAWMMRSSGNPLSRIREALCREVESERLVMLHMRNVGKTGYHAAVVDAVREDGTNLFVHINMGHGGDDDGWFDFNRPIYGYDDNDYRTLMLIQPRPTLSAVQIAGDGLCLDITNTLIGIASRVERATSLAEDDWMLVTNFVPSDRHHWVRVPVTNAPTGFYRVTVP